MTDKATDIQSPCNKVCVLAPDGGPCLGCGRSLDEIVNWLRFTHEQRAAIIASTPGRLARLRAARKAQKESRT